MNHYPHHIGDFNNATRHLSRTERSIYRDLLDLYYDSERPLRNDPAWLMKRILCDGADSDPFTAVLSEFFVLEGDGWHNGRCDRELEAYRKMVNGGIAGANKRWGRGGDSQPIPPLSEPQWQPEPEPEPEPKKKPRVARKTPLPPDFGISERVRAWAGGKGLNHLDQQLEAFLSYVKRNGRQYADWDEALMTAIRDDWAKARGAAPEPYRGKTL